MSIRSTGLSRPPSVTSTSTERSGETNDGRKTLMPSRPPMPAEGLRSLQQKVGAENKKRFSALPPIPSSAGFANDVLKTYYSKAVRNALQQNGLFTGSESLPQGMEIKRVRTYTVQGSRPDAFPKTTRAKSVEPPAPKPFMVGQGGTVAASSGRQHESGAPIPRRNEAVSWWRSAWSSLVRGLARE